MSVTEVSEKDFDTEVASGTVLVDFHAAWCGPCRKMAPFLEEFAAAHPEVKVIKVDVDEAPEIADRYRLMSVPTLALFADGAFVKKSVGGKDTEQIAEFVGV